MSDTSLNAFVARGTAAERGAFTPSEPTPASGPDPGYYWYETDTGVFYAWDGSAWDIVSAGAASSSTDNAIARYDGTVSKLQNSVVTIGDTGIVAYPDNIRQTFNPGADAAGLNVGSIAGDPGTPSNGDLWYDSTANTLDARINGATVNLGSQTGRLIGRQVITATGAGTYTPTTGTASVVIELQGAGGGGGGVAQPGSSNVAFGRGGGGGGYSSTRLTADFSGASYSVGALGAGGSAGNNAGAAGGNTTFTDTAGSPTTYTAGGGSGGNGGAGAVPPLVCGAATAGGTVTNGNIQVPGQYSGHCFSLATAQVHSGEGGSGRFGAGGRWTNAGANASNAGNAATGYGAGGGGACADGTGAAAAGGNGSNGLIVIWEYS